VPRHRTRTSPPALALATLAVLLLAGCGFVKSSPPPAGPDDFAGITTRLASEGITIQHVVSGESGCDDQELARTAIRFEAAGADQAGLATFYLYIFRNRAAFERVRPEVATCATAYVRDPDAVLIEISPYVLASPAAVAPRFAAILREALTKAAGTGG
jgi:hypothetical protein